MNKDLDYYLNNIEYKVPFSDIDDFDRFEERFYEIDRLTGDSLGMGLDFVEFCPNNDPPKLKDELLPWLWLIHPKLYKEICKIADKELNELIDDYNNNLKIEEFTMDYSKNNVTSSIEELLEEFQKSAIAHHKFTLEGDYKRTNAEADKTKKIHDLIKKQGDMDKLLQLIYSDIPTVALTTAVSCMSFNPEKCLEVMEKLSKKDIPLISSGAKYAIMNWNNNEWYID